MPNPSQPTVLITIDVEDWFQVENLKPWIAPETWSARELRVERNVQRLLELLEGFPATFFVLGWLAEKLPRLVKMIADQGHEVASHGYGHQLCSDMTPAELEQDLVRSKQLLEDIIGVDVVGYRAPSFSINHRVLQLLQQCDYRYDSSYNSFEANPRYGRLNMTRYQQNGRGFMVSDHFHELPLSNLTFGNRTLPWSGGGYFRLLPYNIFRRGLQNILSNQGYYLFYLHPWEIDEGQPRIDTANRLARFRHYLNLKSTDAKLRQMLNDLRDCRFSSCRDFISS